jgi:hypothetical protein
MDGELCEGELPVREKIARIAKIAGISKGTAGKLSLSLCSYIPSRFVFI